MPEKATITAIPMINKRRRMKMAAKIETTDDLPADALGEVVCRAVENAWKAGNDPTSFTIRVEFS